MQRCFNDNIRYVADISLDLLEQLKSTKNIEIEVLDNIYIASHTYDSYNRKVSSYIFKDIRFIHINGVWTW